MKIPTIYGYFLFGILLTCPLSVEARLGWTLDQCKKEYGTLKQTEDNMNSFVTGGGRTVNILVDSKGIAQALEITPLSREEAINFKNEYGAGWVTPEKFPDYSIIPSPEWLKKSAGDIHGTEWNYYPKAKVMLMNTEAGQMFLAKQKATAALVSPMQQETTEISKPKGVSSIRQVRKVYVGNLGFDAESRLAEERIRSLLLKSKRFTVTDNASDAQAVVQGAVATRSYTRAYGSSFEGQGYVSQGTSYSSNGTLRVSDTSTGKTLWTWEFKPAKVSYGPFAFGDTDLSKSFVRDLTEVVYGNTDTEVISSSDKKTLVPKRN